jgi:hypothetical protein
VNRLDRAIAAARAVRTELLRSDPRRPRDLLGQCGLAAIQIAVAIGAPRSLRLGFFMNRTTFMGRRGRYPHVHAWNVVDNTIVDVTATQFGRYPAVHVVPKDDAIDYIETADGAQALREMVRDWLLSETDEYREPLRRFRALERRRA